MGTDPTILPLRSYTRSSTARATGTPLSPAGWLRKSYSRLISYSHDDGGLPTRSEHQTYAIAHVPDQQRAHAHATRHTQHSECPYKAAPAACTYNSVHLAAAAGRAISRKDVTARSTMHASGDSGRDAAGHNAAEWTRQGIGEPAEPNRAGAQHTSLTPGKIGACEAPTSNGPEDTCVV